MSKIYALGFCYLMSSLYLSQQFVSAASPQSDRDAIIIIPYKSSDKQISKMKSFKIDGETAIKELSLRVSPEAIIETLANVPEFDIFLEGLDAITIGDVYRSVFPKGVLHSIRQRILRSPLNSDNVVFTVPTNKLEEVIQSEIASTNQTKETSNGSNQNNFVYDEVFDEEGSLLEGLKEEPITDDYVYDQPFEDRFRGDVNRQDDDKPIEENRDLKDVKPLVTNRTEENRAFKDVKPLVTDSGTEENRGFKDVKPYYNVTEENKDVTNKKPLETYTIRYEEGHKELPPLETVNQIEENNDIHNMKPLEPTTIRYEQGRKELSKYGLLFRNWLTKHVVG